MYCLYPGYSLKRAPKDAEKYSSLTSLVQHCPFLKHAVPHGDEAKICAALERRLHVFLSVSGFERCCEVTQPERHNAF